MFLHSMQIVQIINNRIEIFKKFITTKQKKTKKIILSNRKTIIKTNIINMMTINMNRLMKTTIIKTTTMKIQIRRRKNYIIISSIHRLNKFEFIFIDVASSNFILITSFINIFVFAKLRRRKKLLLYCYFCFYENNKCLSCYRHSI